MKDIQYVRITKCREARYWYADHIGLVIPVKESNAYQRWEVLSGSAWIADGDCELVSISINPQKEQEPDLQKAAENFGYPYTRTSPFSPFEIENAFIAGAEWQKQQVQDKGFCISDEQITKLFNNSKCGIMRQHIPEVLKEWFPSASCFKSPFTYSVGQRFKHIDKGEFHLIYVHPGKAALINVENSTTLCAPVSVDDEKYITEEEFCQIAWRIPEQFTLIS